MVVGRWAGAHAARLHEVAHVLLARDRVDHVGGGEEERALRHDDALLRGEQLLERHLERVDPLPLELLEILLSHLQERRLTVFVLDVPLTAQA